MAASKPFTVAIVGGGLGGVVLAIGLLAQRVPVHIYEAAKGFGEIGAGVAFGINSVRSLALVSPALLEAYARHATFNATPELQKTFLSVRYGMSTGAHKGAGEWCFDLNSDDPCFGFPARCCVHRAKFLDEIIKLVPEGTASFGKSLTKIDEEGAGVRLHFSDGTSASASAVIGCDGIKSKARRFVHGPGAQPVYTGDYAYRAMVPCEVFEKALGRELTFNGQMYVGQGGYIVTYPVDHGRLVNVVASRSKPGSTWDHEAWLLPSTEEEMRSELRGWYPPLVSLLAAYSTKEKWALFDYPHQRQYCHGPVCLLGDAAHATTPHLGAGAGQAMEDAYVLSRLIGKAEKAEDLANMFQAYDAVRRPRTQQIVQWSRLSGHALAWMEEGVGDDCARIEDVSNQRFRAVWYEDLEKELQEATALMVSCT